MKHLALSHKPCYIMQESDKEKIINKSSYTSWVLYLVEIFPGTRSSQSMLVCKHAVMRE